MKKQSEQATLAQGSFIKDIPQQKHSQKPLQVVCPQFRSGFKARHLSLLEINMQLVNLVDACQTYTCPYILFLLPFTYHLAETLVFYDLSKSKGLHIQQLFSLLLKKIKCIKQSKNSQLPIDELNQHLFYLHTFQKRTERDINGALGKFMETYGERMQAFFPVYYHLFTFYASEKYPVYDQMIEKGIGRAECSTLMKERFKEILKECKKYHNDQI